MTRSPTGRLLLEDPAVGGGRVLRPGSPAHEIVSRMERVASELLLGGRFDLPTYASVLLALAEDLAEVTDAESARSHPAHRAFLASHHD